MATSNNVRGLSNEASLAVKLAAGAQKHLSTVTQMLVGSASLTLVQVVTQLNAFATLRTDVDTARAALKAKLADEAAQAPALRVFFIAFIAFVQAAFGNSPDILADFGLQPKKVRTPLTAVQKATAAAKRKATREARGTKGPKAKLAVTGNVTGLTMTPITSSTAPAPTAPPPPTAPAPPAQTATAAPPQTAPSASTTPPGATK